MIEYDSKTLHKEKNHRQYVSLRSVLNTFFLEYTSCWCTQIDLGKGDNTFSDHKKFMNVLHKLRREKSFIGDDL